jgi:hypothetical protein
MSSFFAYCLELLRNVGAPGQGLAGLNQRLCLFGFSSLQICLANRAKRTASLVPADGQMVGARYFSARAKYKEPTTMKTIAPMAMSSAPCLKPSLPQTSYFESALIIDCR